MKTKAQLEAELAEVTRRLHTTELEKLIAYHWGVDATNKVEPFAEASFIDYNMAVDLSLFRPCASYGGYVVVKTRSIQRPQVLTLGDPYYEVWLLDDIVAQWSGTHVERQAVLRLTQARGQGAQVRFDHPERPLAERLARLRVGLVLRLTQARDQANTERLSKSHGGAA